MGRRLRSHVHFTIEMTNKGDQKWVTTSSLCTFCYKDDKRDSSENEWATSNLPRFYYKND